MLQRLHLRNFTVFEDAEFKFGPGLNVIVGANGTGKSHVLKVGYAVVHNLMVQVQERRDIAANQLSVRIRLVEDELKHMFQPIPFQAGELIRRGSITSETLITMQVACFGEQVSKEVALTIGSSIEVSPGLPAIFYEDVSLTNPAFIPAKEVLTMGWLLPLYDRREIPIDQTYPDLLRLLMGPPLRQPEPAHIVTQLQQLIGGKVEEEGGRFYLSAPDQSRMEMNLVAEGMRKFATLYKLLANGTLTPETTLFWDEPEANLNPALLKELAAVLTELAKAGFQIILATHSLFLLKELHILAQREKTPVKYFGLNAENGGATQVATADTLTALPNLVALDIEMAQSDAFLDVLNQADADV
jgi:predicted ATPase